ncbi:MAG TPA: hypothetical protein VJA46_06570 [Acidimicrobiia bacterium]|nr:hypothetical protein [Acidimicrobiia bacterium]
MTKRSLSLVAVLALVLAACGGTTETTTTAGADSTTTSPPAEAVLLSYSLADGDEFQYEVGLDQHIDLQAAGDASAMGGEEMPGEASVDISGTAVFTHTVADGPEEGTYEIHITGDFQDVSVAGTIDGEPVDSSEVPDFASTEPVDVTVVVDEQGNVIGAGAEPMEDPLGGILGGLGSLDGGAPAPGLDPGQFFGPLFSDDEVAVGDIWSDEIETPGFGDEPIVTSVTNTITGVEQFDGADVYVIETTSTTSPVEFDLAELFRGLFGAFIPEEATAEETAEFDELMGQLRFLINIDDTTANGTSRFDAEAGVARQSEVTAATHIAMDMMIPDETTGEMIGFQMDMTIDQDITYHLISGPGV